MGGVTGRMDRLCICVFADEIDGFRFLCHALNYKIPTQGGERERGRRSPTLGFWVNMAQGGGWGWRGVGHAPLSEQMSQIGKEKGKRRARGRLDSERNSCVCESAEHRGTPGRTGGGGALC